MLTLINADQIPLTAISGTYNVSYVIISYVVSVIASRIAIMVLQETEISSPVLRLRACCLGALVMGAGIWSMHFTGMLAFKMPMEHSYQPGLTILSMVFAALFSLAVFYNITRENLSFKDILLNAPVMGIGVSIMHYIGMAAMEMRGDILYLSSYFWASITIAVLASGAAMWIMRYVTRAQTHKRILGLSAALIMGLAVCGMHYTGMMATVFVPYADCRFVNGNDQSTLLTFVLLVSLSISLLGLYLLSCGFLKETGRKNKLFSFSGTIFTNSLIVLIGLSIAWFIHYEGNRLYANNVQNFKSIEALEAQKVVHTVENSLNDIYKKLTTLSKLPLVHDQAHRQNISPEILETIAALMQDFKNRGNVSFHIFPSKPDTKTLLSPQGLNLSNQGKAMLEQGIKKHILWFAKKYPTSLTNKESKVPAISDWISDPLRQNNKRQNHSENQTDSILYSVAIYDESGKFSGLASAILTTEIFEKPLYSENAVLIYKSGENQFLFPSKLPSLLRGSLQKIQKQENDPRLLFSESSKLSVSDEGAHWIVWQGSDDSVFLRSDAFQNVEEFRLLGYSLALIMTLLAIGLFNIMRRGYQKEFEREAESNQLKSEFLSNMSHELRTPMHAILNYASMGLKNLGQDGSESLKKYFGNIQVSGNRLMILLNNLLDLAKLEAGRTEFHFAENDLRDVVDHTFIELEPLLLQKSITTDVHYATTHTRGVFDKDKIVQIMINLISNALKFSPEHTTIHIHIDNTSITKDKAILRCSISDEGVGIPEDEISLIFEKFAQSSKTKTQAGGTGLGLSICKQIIEAHGGNIWATNNIGKPGVTFTFEFPTNLSQNVQSEVA